jgi:pyroglutamyl-peptidase
VSKHVLVTGFEPFDDFRVNPSELLVRNLDGRLIAGRLVVGRVLPVETRTLQSRLEEILHEERPEIIIGTGLAAGRAALALERVGINLVDFARPDNVGTMRKNEPILKGGPEARLSTLPLDQIVASWTETGVPGYISNSAGTFLCNQFLYVASGLAAELTPPALCGFVHLPCLPGQALDLGAERTPSMSFDLMKKAMESLIETIVPWIDSRPLERVQRPASQVWIPRGLKEVER